MDTLIIYCTHTDEDVQRHAIDAFFEITGAIDEVVVYVGDEEPDEIQQELQDWWDLNKNNFTSEFRYRDGKLFNLEKLISELMSESYIQCD